MTLPYGLLDPQRMFDRQTQQGVMPPPSSAPAPKPSFRERVVSGARGLLDSARSALNPVPAGFEDLLTPEEIRASRPGLLASLIAHPDAPSYEDRLMGTAARKQAAAGIGQQQNILAARQQIAAQYPPTPDETPDQVVGRLKKMYAAYAAAGDTEMLGKIGEVLKSIGANTNARGLMEVNLGDRVVLAEPTTGEEVTSFATGARPATPGMLTPEEKLTDDARTDQIALEQRLQGQYQGNKQVQDAYAVARGLSAARALLDSNSPQADLGAIIALTKIYDPGSVAREGEVKLTRGAASFPDKLWLFVQRVNSGQMMTANMKAEVRRLINDLEQAQTELVAPIQADFGAQVRRFNAGPKGSLFPIDSATVAPNPLRGTGRPGLIGPSPASTNETPTLQRFLTP